MGDFDFRWLPFSSSIKSQQELTVDCLWEHGTRRIKDDSQVFYLVNWIDNGYIY